MPSTEPVPTPADELPAAETAAPDVIAETAAPNVIAETAAPAGVQPIPGGTRPTAGDTQFEHRPLDEPEGVDFTMLINAMAQPALLYLGEIPHPATGKPTLDLEGARLQIDMLDLLRVKCRGNLTPQEDNLLESVLHQLRMRYVARSGTAV